MLTNFQIREQLNYAAELLEYLHGRIPSVRNIREMARRIETFNFPLAHFSAPEDLDRVHRVFFAHADQDAVDLLSAVLKGGDSSETFDKDRNKSRRQDSSKTPDFGKKCSLIQDLEKEVTPETLALIRLPQMGVMRAVLLKNELGIRNIDELQRDCRRHLIRQLDGFDAALEKRWLQGKWFSQNEETSFAPLSWPVAELIVQFILEQSQEIREKGVENSPASPWRLLCEGKEGNFSPSPSLYQPSLWGGTDPKYSFPPPEFPYRKSLLTRIREFFTSRKDHYARPEFFNPLRRDFHQFEEGASDRLGREPGRGDSGNGYRSSNLQSNALNESPENQERLVWAIEPVGDYRRLEELVESVDYLVATRHSQRFFDAVLDLPFIRGIQERSETHLAVTIEKGALVYDGNKQFPGTVLHFYTCFPSSFFTELIYRSSSEGHWKRLGKQALELGYYLDETGLFKEKERIAIDSEAELYRRLELPYLPPEVRNNLFEFELTGNVPEMLIRREDMLGDLHLHSVFSDGTGTIEEMVEKARSNGLHYIAMTDHSKRVFIAGGMDVQKITQYWQKIDILNNQLIRNEVPFRILKGVEVDVLADGTLDFDDEILAQADWVNASLHFDQGQSRDFIHRRIASALANPYVSAMAHPTGKSYQSDFRLDMDLDFLFETAKKYGKCLELNSQPRRFDLDWQLCRRAKEYGIKIVISTDSHSPSEMDYIRYGVNLARKAGLTPKDIINTRPVEEILALRSQYPFPKFTLGGEKELGNSSSD